MNEKELIDLMKDMGKNVNDVLSQCTTSEAVLKGLLAKRDEIPKGMLDKMDESLKEIRQGRADINEKLEKIDEIFNRDGNNGSK